MTYSSLQNVYCSRDAVRDIYLRDINNLENYVKKEGEFPSEYTSEYSSCIEYARDDLPQQAFLWLSIGQTSTLGYKLPQGVYLGFEPDMNDNICKEMKRLKDGTMKKHFFQNNDFCKFSEF